MINSHFMQEKGPGIIAVGKYLPKETRPNSYFSDILGLNTSDEWIRSHTGIGKRRVAAPHENTSDLATEAAKDALSMAKLKPADLDQIYVATATPDYFFPPTSSLVQKNLDPEKHTAAIDIGNACNGGLAGLEQCFYLVKGGSRKNGVVIGAETLTRFMDYTDRASCVLFGDGAGAALVGVVSDPGPYAFVMGADGSKAANIIFPGGGSVHPATVMAIEEGYFFTKMNGPAVYGDAVKAMTKMTQLALEKAGISKEDVTWWIPHQANIRIMESAAKKLGFQDRMISYIENIGNISAASIFVAMCEAFNDGLLQKGDIIAMAAIGSGYNFGGGVIQWQIENPTPRP